MDELSRAEAVMQEMITLLTDYGLDFIGAILILIIGWIIAGWARSTVRRAVNRASWMDDTLKPLAASLVRYMILIVTVIAVLNQFGVETTSIIAVLGAAGLAVGLALQGTLSNVAAGVMILILRPFKTGDYVDAGGVSGTVQEVGLFTTELATPDNVFIAVPNSSIVSGAISNYSHHATRRIQLTIGIGYGDNMDAALKILLEIAAEDDRILDDPAPQALVMNYGDSSVDLALRCWTKNADFWGAHFDMNKAIKEKLDAAGIEIPFPQRVVEIKNPQS